MSTNPFCLKSIENNLPPTVPVHNGGQNNFKNQQEVHH